ncbi:MAG: hypothetical protein FJY97_15660 [candidate division Zixibacteria bacterium]|nr:hypothetical protein [candidate division Zixibacteria bacterium]
MPSDLEHLLTHKFLRDAAGVRAFRDGHEYFQRGQVYGVVQDRTTISAKVLGLYEY